LYTLCLTPWQTIATAQTDDGLLELRRRGDNDHLIVIAGRVLMNSASRRSEEALATLACGGLKTAPSPHVLIGGLGMAFTLRAALDCVGPNAKITVAELNADIVAWCKGPLAAGTAHAADDPRVDIQVGDVAAVIAAAPPASYDAIVLDLYEGPNAATQRGDDPFYGNAALDRQVRALKPGGVLAVWSEDADAAFAKRMSARLKVTTHRIGGGGRRHAVYIGRT
jgi:spermidine synthase